MKIKEVITKTGLTDRAIRLYIENDLVKPEYDENYNGRKSIDFSENDVEQLKNIALLRKADFSLQEIKALQIGGETAQNTIKEYINRTNEKIQFSNEIIEKIGTLANEENITIEIICEKLSSNLEDKNVPAEDMELSPKEQKEKTRFTVISVIGMVLSGGAMLILLSLLSALRYKYISLFPNNLDLMGKLIAFPIKYFFLIQFALSFIIYFLYKKNKRIGKKKDVKKALCTFIAVLLAISLVFSPIVFSCHFLGYGSSTTNLNNYLEVDEEYLQFEWEEIFQVFPYKVPDFAKRLIYNDSSTTKYYYAYCDGIFNDYNMDIYAEWQYDDNYGWQLNEEYEKEKQRILSKDNIVSIETKGDWQCVHFKKIHESSVDMCDYNYLFFAYNDKTQTVRYIAEFGYKADPYHLQLEW